MLVLSSFLIDKVIDFDDLKSWNNAESEWKRRAVPVTLIELINKGLEPEEAMHRNMFKKELALYCVVYGRNIPKGLKNSYYYGRINVEE